MKKTEADKTWDTVEKNWIKTIRGYDERIKAFEDCPNCHLELDERIGYVGIDFKDGEEYFFQGHEYEELVGQYERSLLYSEYNFDKWLIIESFNW